jgi:GDPmannose 4,6-dehydratase
MGGKAPSADHLGFRNGGLSRKNLIKRPLQKGGCKGNTCDSKRDWGYAKEYVAMMWLMLQQDTPDDYVVATNETHSVQEFVEETFGALDLDWRAYVNYDARYERPAEVDLLVGDPEKARRILGWEPTVRFKELCRIMVEADLNLAKREKAMLDAGLQENTAGGRP